MTVVDWLRCGWTGFKRAPVQSRRATQPVLRLALYGACAASVYAAAAAAGNETQVFQSEVQRFRVVTVADGLEYPWAVAFLPNGSMLVTERLGRLRLIENGKLLTQPIAGVPDVYAQGEGGLLDVALHPEFEKNRLVYLSYSASRLSASAGGGVTATTAVARGRLEGDTLSGVQTIFTAEPWAATVSNFGSRLLFAPGDMLFVTLGDRGSSNEEAQNLGSDLGKIIRLRDDGTIPADNPFLGKSGARPEIYSYGHRNVQGIAQRPRMRQIWAHEHGPNGGDELNLVKPGGNFGWPRITFGRPAGSDPSLKKTEGADMEAPAAHWEQPLGPSGMTFYMGERFANWRGNLFIGSLEGKHLRRIAMERDIADSQEELLKELGEPIRDVRTSPDGFIYVLTEGRNGRLLKLEPAADRGDT